MTICDNTVAISVAFLGATTAIVVYVFAPDFDGKGPAASAIATTAFTGATSLAGKSRQP